MESTRQNNNINAINDVRMLLYGLRNNLSYEETKRIREKLYKKEAVYNFLMDSLTNSLTNKEKKVLKILIGILKILVCILRIKKKHFKKFQKYQYGIYYLFNEHNEEEDYTSNNNINAFKEARKLLNERRSNLLRKETNEIRKKLHKKEAVYTFLKDKEQNSSLTDKESIKKY